MPTIQPIKSVKLKDITSKIGSGATPRGGKNSYITEGIALIRSLNVYDFSFAYEDLAFIDEKQANQLENVSVERDDILLNITGASVCRCCLVPKNVLPARVNQHVSIVRIKPRAADARYVLYAINSPYNKRRLLAIAQGGATREALTKEKIENFEIPIPPLPTQEKIAAILSAYDDLIENNLRRIKILEDMAQNLYREWFVKFRFPGHQKVKMVNSPLGQIPERWEVRILDDVLATLESGSRPKGGIDPEARGVPSIGAENIIGLGRYDYSKEKFVTREFFNKMNRGHVQSGDVLLYKDGAQIGRKSMFRDGFPHAECCINEHVFILRTNGRCSQNYLFFWLDQPEMTQNIINLNANAAQPGINQSGVRGLSILLPPAPLLEIVEQVLEPMLGALFNNAKRNNILRQTRDLLLPKLISGELDLSELDITIPEANA
jgi:type I restriction enzyme S subunit